MENVLDNNVVNDEDTQQGRYLTFTIDHVMYGITIKNVTEIIGIQPITRVPETPDYVKGIINLRGKIVPLIDVRLKFGKEEIPYNERTCVIVIDVDSVPVGLIVDKVEDVLSISEENIARPPQGHVGYDNRYVEGIGQSGDKVQILLDVKKIMQPEEIDSLGKISEGETEQTSEDI